MTVDVKGKFATRIYSRINISATVETAAMGQIPRSTERILYTTPRINNSGIATTHLS